MKKIIPLLVTLMVTLTGCKSAAALKGNWVTTSLIKDNIAQSIAVSNIEFTSKGSALSASGNAGVNVFNGDVKVKGNTFKASDKFAVTKMAGPAAAEEFEMLFLETIMNATEYEINGNKLTIKAPAKKLELQFVKQN